MVYSLPQFWELFCLCTLFPPKMSWLRAQLVPELFSQSTNDMGKIIQLSHSGIIFLKNKQLSGWLKAQRLEASKCTAAAVGGVGFSALCSKTGRQSALPLRNWTRLFTMRRCRNDSVVPDTMVGSIGRIQSQGLAYIFSHVSCPCPQSGTEDPGLLFARQSRGRGVAEQFMVTEVIKALHYLCLATICQYSPMYGSARLYSSLVYLENVALGFGILLFFSALVFFHLWRNSCVH